MSDKKLITVFGATGAQGGSVVDIFLNDTKLNGDWMVRGVTRDTTKDSSKRLAAKGVEVVSADMNDKASLQKAMEGAYAVFAVTNYWEKMDKDLEIKQGRNLADAAVAAGVKHYIWSTLTNIAKVTNGRLPHVYHFDSKAEVADYISTLSLPHTFFQPGCYVSNIPGGMLRQNSAHEPWTLTMPADPEKAQIPAFDPADSGIYVKAIALAGDKVLGKNVYAAAPYVTPAQLLDDFRANFPEAGKTAKYVQINKDQFMAGMTGRGMPEFAAEELFENWDVMNDEGYYGGASLDESLALVRANGDEPTTWAQYIKKSPVFRDLK